MNTGNEDGAHHVISEISGALVDIGYTIPGQAWTYWHLGPGAGPDYLDDQTGHDWSDKTGRAMAANLVAVAEALAAHPMSAHARVTAARVRGRRPPERARRACCAPSCAEPPRPDRRGSRPPRPRPP